MIITTAPLRTLMMQRRIPAITPLNAAEQTELKNEKMYRKYRGDRAGAGVFAIHSFAFRGRRRSACGRAATCIRRGMYAKISVWESDFSVPALSAALLTVTTALPFAGKARRTVPPPVLRRCIYVDALRMLSGKNTDLPPAFVSARLCRLAFFCGAPLFFTVSS